jgi:predicted RNA-binding Zn-ribbon protein involved in translation (DUF1610 family)
MLSAEQLIIVAYLHDCSVLCRRCGEANPETKMGEALSAYEAGEYAGTGGLTCEDCGEEIIEAYTWDCPECGAEYVGSDAGAAEEEYYDHRNCGAESCMGVEKE